MRVQARLPRGQRQVGRPASGPREQRRPNAPTSSRKPRWKPPSVGRCRPAHRALSPSGAQACSHRSRCQRPESLLRAADPSQRRAQGYWLRRPYTTCDRRRAWRRPAKTKGLPWNRQDKKPAPRRRPEAATSDVRQRRCSRRRCCPRWRRPAQEACTPTTVVPCRRCSGPARTRRRPSAPPVSCRPRCLPPEAGAGGAEGRRGRGPLAAAD